MSLGPRLKFSSFWHAALNLCVSPKHDVPIIPHFFPAREYLNLRHYSHFEANEVFCERNIYSLIFKKLSKIFFLKIIIDVKFISFIGDRGFLEIQSSLPLFAEIIASRNLM